MIKALVWVLGFFIIGLAFQNCGKMNSKDDKSSWQKSEILAPLNPGYFIESDGSEDYTQRIFKIDFQQNKIYGKNHDLKSSTFLSNQDAFSALTVELTCDVHAEIQALNVNLSKANICRYHGVYVLRDGEQESSLPTVLPPTYYQTIFRKDGSEATKGQTVNNCFTGPCEHAYDYETICYTDEDLYKEERRALSTKVFAECF